jgi:carbonic anhydrase
MPTIKRIKQTQAKLALKQKAQLSLDTPARHQPEILLIGCVDARLDPIADLGIPKGKALIYRNIAALVHGKQGQDDNSHMSEEAALEFAVNVMGVKHIVVMGHTDCGGIQASLDGTHDHKSIHAYLKSLDAVRDGVVAQGGDASAQARAMEEAAVCQSMQNLRSYEVVQRAFSEGRLQLHGWVINTASGIISEMDHITGAFSEFRAA